MVTFTLNGTEVQTEEGRYLLLAARDHGVHIPTLCHHDALEPAGMCRLCTVEVFDGRRTRFVTACNYPVREGIEVLTDSAAVREGRKLIIELLLARCPGVRFVKDLAARHGIQGTRFETLDSDCILCGLCVRMCEKMGNSALSLTGRGVHMVVDTPFHLHTEACRACAACVSVCPTGHIDLDRITGLTSLPIPSEYDMGLRGRKPIYIPYAQAVPNTPAIDRRYCMHFKTDACGICAESCGTGAIDYTQQDEFVELTVGSIILAPGFQPFDPTPHETYGYAKSPNVVTSMEFERILSASGPTLGHLVRPGDRKEPEKIAWLQCVGSRDVNRCDHGYCSSVCCMYAVKEAVIAKEHAPGDLDCAVFFMDMRTHGKDFERYCDDARDTHGVRFIRSRVPTVEVVEGSDDLVIPYVDEDGHVVQERFDMVVLSVGLETSKGARRLAGKLGIRLTEGGFCETDSFDPVSTNREGIYVCGAFQGPKDIPQSVVEASSAAACAGALLKEARHTLTHDKVIPEQRTVTGERPRIGVFVCRCGINIAGVVDVPAVRDYAASLPYVEYVTDNLYTCSQDTQKAMSREIRDMDLNRIVVAACTPKTHEPLFQETLVSAGLNKYLFEMTNIRNQDSWVHKDDPVSATEKAKDLVRMAVAKVALMEPLAEARLEVNRRALVVGGGISGLTSARSLSEQGYEVCLVERAEELGGQARRLFRTWKGEDVRARLAELVASVTGDPRIELHTATELREVEGFVGNFTSTLRNADGTERRVEHGVAVLATGADELKPDEYLYGRDPRVVTHLELDEKFRDEPEALRAARAAVFIQCVGSREPGRPYCSRLCCTHAVERALGLKELNPDMNVYVLYRDIRTYGEREYLYREARLAGVMFIRYRRERKPTVTSGNDGITVEVWDPILGETVEIEADLVALASAVVPCRNEALARLFKVPLDGDGFFVEKHAKLGPSEFATDGVFLCGMAHYPKPVDESTAQALAASSRAATLLAGGSVTVSGTVAEADPSVCSGCGVCVNVCPYSAPSFIEEGRFAGRAEVNAVLCKGCGLCVASCRSGALNLKGFGQDQIMAMIDEI